MNRLRTALIGLTGFILIALTSTTLANQTSDTSAVQRGVNITLLDEDFTNFLGNGFAPSPSSGQLDSDTFRLLGMSTGDGTFGSIHTDGDFARGLDDGDVGTGGAYAFIVEPASPGPENIAFGVQPGSSDFTPGSLDIQIVNTTGAPLTQFDLEYTIWIRNNEDRSNSLNFSWSLNDTDYTAVASLDYTSPTGEDNPAAWVSVPRSTTVSGFILPAGDSLYLRWTGDDEGGSGSRDEFGIDDIVVIAPPPSDIVLAKLGPANAIPGDALTYAISITNPSGTLPLTELVLTDVLPAELTYVSDTSGIIPTQPGGNVLQWALPDLAAGSTFSFDLVVDSIPSIAPGTMLTNELEAIALLDGLPVNTDTTFDTTFIELVTIQVVQEPTDITTSDASPRLGETLAVEGTVTAAPGEFDDNGLLTIQNGTGAWSGLVISGDFSALTIERGDQLLVIGEVTEPNGLTTLVSERVELSTKAILPPAELIDTSEFPDSGAAASEQWEAVLVEFTDVDVTNTLGFGEWEFDDGSGVARGDDFGNLGFGPAVGDEYGFLRGIGWFSFGAYKVQPRDNDDIEFLPNAVTIEEIQGTGLRSPFAPPTGNDPGAIVRTLGNIVTAVGDNGFFIQSQEILPLGSRGLPGTEASSGLFVFTGTPPAVLVGDLVDITGAVAEFFDFTQIALPDSIEVVSSGNTLPIPLALDSNTPSPDPENLSCGETQFECYEGMRVSVPNGFVTASSQSFGSDPVAEAVISADGARILRETGEAFPGIVGCPGCPVWSGAPELFEIDPDRFGLRTEPLTGGTEFSATGVIGFSFGDYALWPTELNISSEPSLPNPVPDFGPTAITIGSLNALNFFDDELGAARPITACGSTDDAIDREVLSTTDYATKLNKLAVYIVTGLGGPDVLAMQEVESEQVLQDLADEIALIDASLIYTPSLLPGNDRGNINNGYLINAARITIDSIALAAEEECLTVDNSPLHDRPPLLLRARFIAEGNDLPFAVYNNHFRSLGGVSNADGRTRLKRHEQAQSVAALVQALQTSEPELPILVIGDLNAFQFTDGFADVVGHLRGTADPSQNFVSVENSGIPGFDDSNITNPTLRLPLETLPMVERYSFIFQGVSQTLDHALLDDSAWQLFEDLSYSRANADYWVGFEFDVSTEARSSDHDGLVITLNTDRIFSDSFESD